MAINAYVGLQGHGKSYEVVANVIVPAIEAGRRVVTNIVGIKYETIADYLVEKGKDPEKLGKLVIVANEQIALDTFFPTEEQNKESKEVTTIAGDVVEGGDMVVVDEAWRYWGQGMKTKPRHQEFFANHRHYLNANGDTCDLVVISQDITLIGRGLSRLIENTFQMTKLKQVGQDGRYRVDVFLKTRMRKPYRTWVSSYQPRVFAFYSSYNGKNAKEQAIDKRQNALRSKVFILGIPLLLVAMGLGLYGASRFFHPKQPPKPVGADGKANPGTPGAPVKPSGPVVSDSWRITGYYYLGSQLIVFMENQQGLIRRLQNPDNVKIFGNSIEVVAKDGVFTSYSGGGNSILGRVTK